MKLLGFMYLLGYILMVGVASFLQKFTMKMLSPYQINFLMAIGMVVTAIPALFLVQKNFAIPTKSLPLGFIVGLLMALGSISYVLSLSKLPVSMAAAISSSYLIVVVVLSWFFLHESFSLPKIIGIVFTLIGVAILSIYA